ncbi:MAG: ABC transporter ATP-binding protein [Deferrisomatales bacterium]|nr:ABC transporter ATP-binding protein [Deferrisomatales bacterium]
MIELRGLQRTFAVGDQAVHALSGVDLSVATGEYVSIMGPSGSGKSTLLHVLGLLDRPSAGSYLLEGSDVTGLDEAAQATTRREKIGFVFQFFHLVPRLTAAQNVELPLVLAGLAPAQRRERVAAALESLGLAPRAHHRPDQLSGGQRQRVAIARATVTAPSLLLADEPTGNLDRTAGREVLEILEGLNGKGLTLLVVTHDPEIGGRARRRVQMVDGRIESDRVVGAG